MRGRITDASVVGCSWISLARKCLWPALAIESGSQGMSIVVRVRGRSRRSENCAAWSARTTAISSASRTWTLCVWRITATKSEAMQALSPLRPTTSPPAEPRGGPRRANRASSGDSATMACAPSSCRTAAPTALARSAPASSSSPIRCAMTSVSVSDVNAWPEASSPSRRSAKLSVMPLWTITTRPDPSRCGCALASVAAPWVAQRVWPMPVVPSTGAAFTRASRSCRRPARRRTLTPSGPRTASPAES